MAAVFYIDPAPDIYSPSPNTAVENPNETDFIFPPSPSPAAADSGRTGDDSSPTTAVNPQAGFKGDGRLESPIEHSGRNLRLLDSAVKAELIGAVQQRHNRSVSSTSAQSNRSTSSNSSSVFNQRPIKARRFSTGLVYYELLSNIGA